MQQERKTKIYLASLVLIALVICGFLGYINDPRRVSANPSEITPGLAAKAKSLANLNYCYSMTPDPCIVSFGLENVDNSLIIIRNYNPSLTQFYLKIKETDDWQTYECQPVQLSSGTFYCWGSQIRDGATVTMEVYSKNDDRLIASGVLLVSSEATPVLNITNTPANGTVMPTVKVATGTPTSPNPGTSLTPPYPYP